MRPRLKSMKPPATRTLPLDSSVAVCSARAVSRLPVPVHVPVAGSYSSALLRAKQLCGGGPQLKPPATRTLPFGSKVAVCPSRSVLRSAVRFHVPAAGSYSSALLKDLLLSLPPATRTLPLGSSVEV